MKLEPHECEYVREVRDQWEAYLDSPMSIGREAALGKKVGRLLGIIERAHLGELEVRHEAS